MKPPAAKKFYLFGFPIAHSAAPALHNHCFAAWGASERLNSYELWSTSKINHGVISQLRSDECGGAAITMPLKTEILRHLDDISPESCATGACNTIVKKPGDQGCRLIGQNTDILGVRNALIRGLRSQFSNAEISTNASYSETVQGAGLVIGGGATTRSAAYVLTMLGLSPNFHHQSGPRRSRAHVELRLGQKNSPAILMAVGAIPAVAPVTPAEHGVYTTVSAVLTIPYERRAFTASDSPPTPLRRIFLEMAYKPRLTPMLQAAIAHGWHGLDGIQAMIEQGLAQQRMWYTGDASVSTGSDPNILNASVEQAARELCEGMSDVVVVEGTEIDRALVDIIVPRL